MCRAGQVRVFALPMLPPYKAAVICSTSRCCAVCMRLQRAAHAGSAGQGHALALLFDVRWLAALPPRCARPAGQDIPDDVIMEIAQHENFLGVKECTGAARRACKSSMLLRTKHACCFPAVPTSCPFLPPTRHLPTLGLTLPPCAGNDRIERYHQQGVLCWSGNDDEAHAGRHQHHAQVRAAAAQTHSAGAMCSTCLGRAACTHVCYMSSSPGADCLQGVISVTSNVIPGLFSKLMQQARRGRALAGACAGACTHL